MGLLLLLCVAGMGAWRYRSVLALNRRLTSNAAEHERTDAMLRDSEKSYRSILENMLDTYYCADLKGRIVMVSRSSFELLGYTPQELVGRNMADLRFGDDRDTLVAELERNRGRVADYQARLRRKDGREIWVSSTARYRLGPDGLVTGIEGTARDITSHRRSDTELRRLAAVVETSVDAIVVTTAEGVITVWNRAAEAMFGFTADEATGMPISIVAPADRNAEILEAVKAGAEGNRVERYETVRQRKDGTLIDVAVALSPIRDADGKTIAVSGIIRDITERKRAVAALRASEAQTRLVTDAIPAEIAYYDRAHRVRFANAPYARARGVARDDTIGRHMRDLIGSDRYELFRDKIERTLAGEVTSTEGVWDSGDGTRKYYRSTRVPHVGDDGAVLGYFIIIVDLTEHHEREVRLRQAQKMEALGQLTGGIAHEFNNLLMIIAGNLEIAIDRARDHATRKFATAAMGGAMRGAELTKQLLAFSRTQNLSVGRVEPNRLVGAMREMLQTSLGETISVETQADEGVWAIHADSGQLEGALLNLTLNARDALPDGGTIVIATSNSRAHGARPPAFAGVATQDYVVIEVSDTGVGMTAETAERAFDPFFTTKDVGRGTGLGLSMVHGFAEQSGGFVEIDSGVGRGTKVRIFLPRVEGQAAMPKRARHQSAPPLHMDGAILVVEDNVSVRNLVVQLLLELGCEPVEAEDGEAALALLHERPDIDVMLTDVVLPGGMSGPNIARQARARRPDLKVVFTSGYPDREQPDLGANGERLWFIRKPYRMAELAETLAAALESGHTLDEDATRTSAG